MGEAWEQGYANIVSTCSTQDCHVSTLQDRLDWSYFRVLSHTLCQRSLMLGVRVERVDGFMANTFRQANNQRTLSGLQRGDTCTDNTTVISPWLLGIITGDYPYRT